MKKILYGVMIIVLALASKAQTANAAVGDLINIKASGSTYTGVGAGIGTINQTWNNMLDGSMVLSNGVVSGVTFDFTATGLTTITNSVDRGFNGTINNNLMNAYIYSGIAQTMTFTGLDPFATYDLTVYSQSEKVPVPPTQKLKITANGITTTSLASVGTNSTFVSGTNYLQQSVTADRNGILYITYAPGIGTTKSVVNALQLLETSAPVPEPARLILMGVGCLFVVFYLRKSQGILEFVA